ncbi:MAG TPA: hypothetical protein VJM83_02575 [Nitrospirota bacterium]|nr:hypothetical protein [Nitrospirota bacterium]
MKGEATRAVMVFIFAAAVLIPVGCKNKEDKKPPTGMEHTEMMLKQHQAMQGVQTNWIEAKAALSAGKLAEAENSAAAIERASFGLEEFMVHKNPDRKDDFLALAARFHKLLGDFKTELQKGDKAKAVELVTEIDKACNACHAMFRQ